MARAARTLCRDDDVLRAVIRTHGLPPLWSRRPGFATLVHIIFEQQVTLASGRAALERLRSAAGRVDASSVARLDEDAIRAAGITRQKAHYCRELAKRIDTGTFSLRRLARENDAKAREQLMTLKGIGAWTADVYLLFALGRCDIWPPGDIALINEVKRLKHLAGDATDQDVQQISAKWRPWRSVAARIIWHSYLRQRRPHTRAKRQREI